MRLGRALSAMFRRRRSPDPKPLILMYHRIADEPADPWGLAVHPARFEEQLEVLRRTRHPLALADFAGKLQRGTLPPNAVALTFDDGYADNLLAAKPRLAAAEIPASVFLATAYLERPGEFWWDEIGRLILLTSGPEVVELVLGGVVSRFELGTEPPPSETRVWRGWTAPTTKRQAAFVAIWDALRRLDDTERQEMMAKLRADFAACKPPDGSGRAMVRDEVQALVRDGLITIGAHTMTHPILTELAPADCNREIAGSKEICEDLIGATTAGFAYPYGAINDCVRSAVTAAGFAFGVCSLRGPAGPGSDPMALPRIQIFDWDGDAFERALHLASAEVHA
jgi:peptidoglycan/xylan/chitin deacetylase (PgdA/CDA1 family)